MLFERSWGNCFDKNSTPFLLHARDLETAVTKRIEFSEKLQNKERSIVFLNIDLFLWISFVLGYKV